MAILIDRIDLIQTEAVETTDSNINVFMWNELLLNSTSLLSTSGYYSLFDELQSASPSQIDQRDLGFSMYDDENDTYDNDNDTYDASNGGMDDEVQV